MKVFVVFLLLWTGLATSPLAAAVLRKKSGRAIIMGFSRAELEKYAVGQYIVIENFEKNQWTGLIKKIYRVNRVRITLIDDDAEEMEEGEVFRIKSGEAPRSIARPEFDPSEVPADHDDPPLTVDDPNLVPSAEPMAPHPLRCRTPVNRIDCCSPLDFSPVTI
jgi:hypothetical protein